MWVSTSKPSDRAWSISALRPLTFFPTTKNVPATPLAFSASKTLLVHSLGPSSKVSATAFCPPETLAVRRTTWFTGTLVVTHNPIRLLSTPTTARRSPGDPLTATATTTPSPSMVVS